MSDPVPGNVPDELVELATKALTDEGGAPGNSLHGWRCSYPDRYGPCNCVKVTVEVILAAVLPVARQQLADEIEAKFAAEQGFPDWWDGEALEGIKWAARVVRGDP